MWIWWIMFVSNLLIPAVLIVAGRMMWKRCPQKINRVYGYRTSRSMKNMDTWQFAHNYCGKLWWKLGWFSLVPSIVVQIPFYNSSEEVVVRIGLIVCIVQTVILIASIFPTEVALKKTFNDDGTRR